MNRVINLMIGKDVVQREMPLATEEVLPGVLWGDPWTLFTPSHWLAQAWMSELDRKHEYRYRARDGIVGELVFCLLGGYGITAELATAAYELCKELGLLVRFETRSEAWTDALSNRLQVGGRELRYRFPNQKARFLANAMAFVSSNTLCSGSGLSLRDQLLEVTGVGYKTASWVARNALDCDDVAVLDIHVVRAGRLCGLFTSSQKVERDYLEMERLFLAFCGALNVRPAALDYLIWEEMRAAGSLPVQLLAFRSGTSQTEYLSNRKARERQLLLAF